MSLALESHTLLALHAWLQACIPDLGELQNFHAERLPAGQSNPTWLLRDGSGRRWVMRAKPAPAEQLLPSAHAIEREVAVLTALAGTEVPVPSVKALCEDESVIGVAFYVMDFVEGQIIRDTTLPTSLASERKSIHQDALRVLAALHAVDWKAKGLSSYGRQDGFFERMITRWTKQYRATAVQPIDAMERLIEWLPANIPPLTGSASDVCIVHGDFRLENLIIHPTEQRVVAVLDWELSTIGHPLSDLAYYCMAWHLPQGILRGIGGLDLRGSGIPSEEEVIHTYCQLAGRRDEDSIHKHWPFYLACNLFRLSAILQGIGFRAEKGISSSATAMETARMARPVAELATHLISRT